MNAQQLPEGYREFRRIDLQRDKKLALLINGLCLVMIAAMVVAGILIVPITLAVQANGILEYLFWLVSLLLCIIAYMILHEMVHGIFMKHYSGIKPTYGFTGLYAFAGSSAYFDKKSYRVIALSPVVILGALLIVLNLVLPRHCFWFVYLIQVMNISGAAGDLYVSAILSKMPEDTLINDSGVRMVFFSKSMPK